MFRRASVCTEKCNIAGAGDRGLTGWLPTTYGSRHSHTHITHTTQREGERTHNEKRANLVRWPTSSSSSSTTSPLLAWLGPHFGGSRLGSAPSSGGTCDVTGRWTGEFKRVACLVARCSGTRLVFLKRRSSGTTPGCVMQRVPEETARRLRNRLRVI